MTSAQLYQWIQHPECLDRESLYELRTLVARYPYFQTLRLLYLKNLFLLHDSSFGTELRKAVLYVADRRTLFYLIEGDRYALERDAESLLIPKTDDTEEPGVDRTLFLIDAFLATMPDEHVQPAGLDYAMDYTAYLLNSGKEGETDASEENVPKLRGQDLIDGFLNRMDDGVDLAAQPEENIEEGTTADEGNFVLDDEKTDGGEAVQPEVPQDPVAGGQNPEDESDSLSPSFGGLDDSCFTETLAKIYIKQHRYEKALEIIKKLSLNYPKKNAYFADQIRFLEKLIINAKSK